MNRASAIRVDNQLLSVSSKLVKAFPQIIKTGNSLPGMRNAHSFKFLVKLFTKSLWGVGQRPTVLFYPTLVKLFSKSLQGVGRSPTVLLLNLF